MSKELIREIVVNVVGKQAEPIADLLNSKKHVNEFNLAKKLEITINQTRNLLYKLSDQGLVSSIRKKDKKKGWYTYFWKIENLKAFEFLKGLLDQRTNQINAQIASREKNQFYVCERCNLEYKEENALFMDFTCDECGEIFKVKDNSKLVRALQRNLKSIDGEMKLVEIEIQKERDKIEKQRIRKDKKEKAEKTRIRKEKAAIRKAIRDKEKKKAGFKKTVKKKVAKKKGKKKAVKRKVKKLAKKKKVVKKVIKKKSKRQKASSNTLKGTRVRSSGRK
ncbi:hypothetical protein HN832_00960 [archaeon]|jgi:transcription factor E|nr:hypothetical protein [archaeon]MBT4373781.1 hypothetical protein [archaeon]MBT4532247.1 hypothetical protein [archaeon]MBT7001072.1 hypothetical protein [archaeon]MBT7281961.1 hypothetical protein [archaeon]